MSKSICFRPKPEVEKLLDDYMRIRPDTSKSLLINWALLLYLSDQLKEYSDLYLEKDR